MRRAPDGPSLSAWQFRLLGLLARGYDVGGIERVTMYSRPYIYKGLRELRENLGARTYAAVVVEGLRLGVIELPGKAEMAAFYDDNEPVG